jgi:hypothetical protein
VIDTLAKLRALADEMDATPLYDDHGGAFAALLRDRFPEAFEEDVHMPANVLVTGSPEQVALDYLAQMSPDGQASDRISSHIQRCGAWRSGDSLERILGRCLRKRHGFVVYDRRRKCWFATDAGRAEAARHEETR